jgi:hypothetical protein
MLSLNNSLSLNRFSFVYNFSNFIILADFRDYSMEKLPAKPAPSIDELNLSQNFVFNSCSCCPVEPVAQLSLMPPINIIFSELKRVCKIIGS